MNESIDSSNTLEQICRETLTRFSAVWGAGDVDTVLGLMSDEPTDKGSTSPEPVTVFVGKEEVRAAGQRGWLAPMRELN
jgi:hypothetical protein